MTTTSSLPPGCEPSCHGCRHRSLSAEESAAQKGMHLSAVLAPWLAKLAPLGPAQARLGYRERVSLNAAWDKGAGWRFGLVRHRDRKDEFLAIPDCPVHAPRVNAALAVLARELPPGPEFPLAFVAISGAQVTLIVKTRSADAGWGKALGSRLGELGVEGLWLHLHPSAGRRLFARSGWRLLWGKPRSLDGQGALHGPTAFSQPQAGLHGSALDAMDDFLKPGQGAVFVDLYCGIGKGLARAAKAGAACIGIELSGEAVECAGVNAPGAVVLRGACGLRLPQLDAFLAEHPRKRRLLAVNPPRSGLEPEVRRWIGGMSPERVAYLSCSAGTLARDLRDLEAGGLVVERLLPYDFFPMTHHVEVLALLVRR